MGLTTVDSPDGNFKLLGGQLALDFANTVDWRESDQAQELLPCYSDLVAWSQRAGILSDDQVNELLRQAERDPSAAAEVLKRATDLRETIHGIYSAIAGGANPHAEDIAAFNAELSAALGHLRVVAEPAGIAWGWSEDAVPLDRMLWPILRTAADLLTSPQISKVRQCADQACGWLFLDRSRNGSRRWCEMDGCGNRAKARRHYQKKRLK